MIYTTYFANLRNLPPHITPISICRKSPKGWKGAECKALAPDFSLFYEWKRRNYDNFYYTRHFQEQVLDQLNIKHILARLRTLGHGGDVALVCYEKPGNFCHRHLVANWLRKNGVEVKEL